MRSSIVLVGHASEMTRLAKFVEEFATTHDLAEAERARLLIVLEELLTNVAKYGYDADGAAGTVTVVLALEGDRLSIEFEDDGKPFDPLAQAPPGLDQAVEERSVGGLGLHIVRSLVEAARYAREEGRNRLVLERRIGP